MFLYNDFPLILKLLVQIASIFSAKHFCRRNASPKAFFNRFLKRGHNFNLTKIVGFLCKSSDLPTYGLTHNAMKLWLRFLTGGSSHNNYSFGFLYSRFLLFPLI